MKNLKGPTLLVLTAIIWGTSFVAQKLGMNYVEPLTFGATRFLLGAVVLVPIILIFDRINTVIACAGPILYAAIMVVGIAYTLQIIGQKSTDPTAAAIILSMESLFAVISGAIFLKEVMSMREIIGCVIMFSAVIITQIKTEDKDNSL